MGGSNGHFINTNLNRGLASFSSSFFSCNDFYLNYLMRHLIFTIDIKGKIYYSILTSLDLLFMPGSIPAVDVLED